MEIAGVELPEEATEGTTQEERVASWFGMTKRMTNTLQALLDSPVYGRHSCGLSSTVPSC